MTGNPYYTLGDEAEELRAEVERLRSECAVCEKCGHVQAEPNWCHKCSHRTAMPDWARPLLDAWSDRQDLREALNAVRSESDRLREALTLVQKLVNIPSEQILDDTERTRRIKLVGALLAPLLLLARQLVLWLLAGVGLGAAGAVAVRRLLK